MNRMCGGVRVSALVWIGAAISVLAATGTVQPGDALPWDLRDKLVEALETRASKLAKDQRPTYSKGFHKTGEDSYQVSFVIDTAGSETMKTERFNLTLQPIGSGSWEVTDEQLMDTQEVLVRDKPGDEKFYRFSSFSVDREGLKIRGTDGAVVTDSLLGEVDQITLASDDLSYEYDPPANLGRRRDLLYRYLEKARADDFVFRPEVVVINCDPGSCRDLLGSAFQDLEETDLESVTPGLRRYFESVREDQASEREENPFTGFDRRREPDQQRYSLHVKRTGDDHWLVLRHDVRNPWEVTFRASGYGMLYGYPSARSQAKSAPHDIERRDDGDATDFQLEAVTGTVEVATERSELLKADIEFTLELKRDLQELSFSFEDLTGVFGKRSSDREPAITVDLLQTGGGEDLTWVRLGTSRGLVLLPQQMPAGSQVVLRMRFQNEGSILKLSPSYSYIDRGGWLPFVRYTDKIEKFDLTIDAPSRYTTLAVGTKASEERRGRITRTRWVANSPVHFPTIIFGDYFHDSPSTRAEKSDGSEIPVDIYVDNDSMTDWAIRPKQLRPLAEQAVNALNIYRTLFGVDYPYGKLDLVNDPNFIAGQAPASIIYLGSGTFRSSATLSEFLTPYGNLAQRVESLVAHEVAHQWWGSLVGNANTNNYWFIESLAEYSAALYLEVMASEGFQKPELGRKAYLDHVASWRDRVIDSNLMCSVQDARTLWSNGGYGAALYAKGPYAFHILRTTFGDERFFGFLKALAQETAGREIVTRDIQAVAELALGGVGPDGKPYKVDLEWFFDQWIRGVGLPLYRFEYGYRQTEDGSFIVEGAVKQQVVVGNRKLQLPGVFFRGLVPITVVGKDKQEYTARVIVEGPDTPFQFKVPVEPKKITLNKYGEILARKVIDLPAG